MQQFLRQKVRPNILSMPASTEEQYADARAEAKILLNAGESPFNSPYNRYPDSRYTDLCTQLAVLRGIRSDCIFPAASEEEVADLLMRIFCMPGRDNVVAIDPTRPLYARLAALNDVEYRRAALGEGFSLSSEKLLQLCNAQTKLILLCSPNSPTGNSLDRKEMLSLLDNFDGIVVVDEAYIDFASVPTFIPELQEHKNLVVIQSFSKAWASAGLGIATAYARPELVALLRRVEAPYNLSLPVVQETLSVIRRRYDIENWVKQTLDERVKVLRAFRMLPFYISDYPTETNFFLVRVKESSRIYTNLRSQGILVDDCAMHPTLSDCLRITIGAPHENSALLGALRKM